MFLGFISILGIGKVHPSSPYRDGGGGGGEFFNI